MELHLSEKDENTGTPLLKESLSITESSCKDSSLYTWKKEKVKTLRYDWSSITNADISNELTFCQGKNAAIDPTEIKTTIL